MSLFDFMILLAIVSRIQTKREKLKLLSKDIYQLNQQCRPISVAISQPLDLNTMKTKLRDAVYCVGSVGQLLTENKVL